MSILVSWSGGKDCAFALHTLRLEKQDVAGLLVVLAEAGDGAEVPMHRIPEQFVRRQAESLGLPMFEARIPNPCDDDAYGGIMTGCLLRARDAGVTRIAFGDLYLEEVRRRRVDKMAGTGIEPIFPLWLYPTAQLARDFLASGFKAQIAGVDPAVLDESWVGRAYDEDFLASLPDGADPCAENGEFHTFVHDGPIFRHSVPRLPSLRSVVT